MVARNDDRRHEKRCCEADECHSTSDVAKYASLDEFLRRDSRPNALPDKHKYGGTLISHGFHMETTWTRRALEVPGDPEAVVALFAKVDLSPLEPLLLSKFSSKKRRPPCQPLALLKALVYQRLRKISSYRQLASELQDKKELWTGLGFNRAPSHQVFSEFTKRLGCETFSTIFECLVRQLKWLVPSFGEVVVFDSTLIRAYANPNPKSGRRSDPDAGHGVRKERGKKAWVYGYKVHCGCDAASEIPCAYTVTSGNRHDSTQYRFLLEQAAATARVSKVVTDSGYDTKQNNRLTLFRYGADPIIDLNPRRGRNRRKRRSDYLLRIQRDTPEWRYYAAMGSAIERVFSRLKEELGLDNLKVRRLPKVEAHVLLSLITMLVIAYAAVANGRPDLQRSIKPWRYKSQEGL